MANGKSDGRGRTSRELTLAGFGLRFVGSLALVIATYNPSGYSFVGWLRATTASETASLGPEHFVIGIGLLIGWVILLAATQRSPVKRSCLPRELPAVV